MDNGASFKGMNSLKEAECLQLETLQKDELTRTWIIGTYLKAYNTSKETTNAIGFSLLNCLLKL